MVPLWATLTILTVTKNVLMGHVFGSPYEVYLKNWFGQKKRKDFVQ